MLEHVFFINTPKISSVANLSFTVHETYSLLKRGVPTD